MSSLKHKPKEFVEFFVDCVERRSKFRLDFLRKVTDELPHIRHGFFEILSFARKEFVAGLSFFRALAQRRFPSGMINTCRGTFMLMLIINF